MLINNLGDVIRNFSSTNLNIYYLFISLTNITLNSKEHLRCLSRFLNMRDDATPAHISSKISFFLTFKVLHYADL